MSRSGVSALIVVGLVSVWVGTLIGAAFGIPALGLNRYGGNSVETTVVGEAFAGVFYLFGTILEIRGGRALAQLQPTSAKLVLILLAAVTVLVPGAVAVQAARNGYWETVPIVFILQVFVVAPLSAGVLSVQMGFRSPRSRQGGAAGRRSERQSK